MGQSYSSPILQAPETVSGIHSEVELTGNGLVLSYTSPMPPLPMAARTSYGPRRVPEVRAKPLNYTGISDLPAPDDAFIHQRAAERTRIFFIAQSSRF